MNEDLGNDPGARGAFVREGRAQMLTPLLEARGLTKTFPGCIANDKVSFRIQPGELLQALPSGGGGWT